MKKIRFSILFFLFFAGALKAEAALISGKVDSYDESTRKLVLVTQDPSTGRQVKTDVWLDSNAKAEGFSPAGIQPGSAVWVDTETDSEGNLRADSITKA